MKLQADKITKSQSFLFLLMPKTFDATLAGLLPINGGFTSTNSYIAMYAASMIRLLFTQTLLGSTSDDLDKVS